MITWPFSQLFEPAGGAAATITELAAEPDDENAFVAAFAARGCEIERAFEVDEEASEERGGDDMVFFLVFWFLFFSLGFV